MAYSKVSNKTQDKELRYLNKDYNSFKDQLLDFAQVYFPNTYNDFSEGSPGMLFIEMAAYVGDVLSFYTDTQLKETFLSLAQEKENLYSLAYSMGYRPKIITTSTTDLELYHLVPSKLVGTIYKPDYNYAIKVNEGSTFNSSEGSKFRLDEKVDFNHSSSFSPTEVNVYQLDTANNPQYYLLKKTGKVISAETISTTFSIGSVEKFKVLNVPDAEIIGIESITDSDGNRWYEVDYLAQDTIFEDVENTGGNDPDLHQYTQATPYLLKLKKVPKRYITRFLEDGTLQIQFGGGISDKDDEQIIPNPDNIGLGIRDGRNKMSKAYDPSNFLYTRAYGQAPSNTTLTVTYLKGGGMKANVGANTINKTDSIISNTNPNLNGVTRDFCLESLTCTNPNPALGGGTGDSIEELRMNTMASFSAQNRAVTKDDYIVRTYSMPAKLGRVAKAYMVQDDQLGTYTGESNRIPNPLALNMYVLGYNKQKQLTKLNPATKQNLATYLEQQRMLTDAINIKDAYAINISVDFEIITFKTFNNEEVVLNCINELKDFFSIDKWQINQPIITTEIYNLLGTVEGVMNVQKITIDNLSGQSKGYSQYKYDIIGATKNGIIYPSLDPSIFEVRFPDINIKGRTTTY